MYLHKKGRNCSKKKGMIRLSVFSPALFVLKQKSNSNDNNKDDDDKNNNINDNKRLGTDCVGVQPHFCSSKLTQCTISADLHVIFGSG